MGNKSPESVAFPEVPVWEALLAPGGKARGEYLQMIAQCLYLMLVGSSLHFNVIETYRRRPL